MDSHDKISNFNLKSVNMRLEHYNIGITYFFMKNYDEAIKEFSIAIEILLVVGKNLLFLFILEKFNILPQ